MTEFGQSINVGLWSTSRFLGLQNLLVRIRNEWFIRSFLYIILFSIKLNYFYCIGQQNKTEQQNRSVFLSFRVLMCFIGAIDMESDMIFYFFIFLLDMCSLFDEFLTITVKQILRHQPANKTVDWTLFLLKVCLNR